MTKEQTDRILIVDDDSDIATALKLLLEEAGYETVWTVKAEDTLNVLQDGAYSLALLDVCMPGISGLDILHRIRRSGLDTAVIMMTGHGSEELVAECMKAGAADYVTKPFDPDRLTTLIDRAIANRRDQLEKRRFEKVKDDFFLMLSHDLKNPITAALGSIDIMREGRLGPVNAEQADYLQSAIESCEEIIAMIDNLLDLQRFSSDRILTRIKQIEPCQLITAVAKRFSPAAERENMDLICESGDDVPLIAVDSGMMTRVIANILANAIKFTPEGGTITVSCRAVACTDVELAKFPSHVVSSPRFADLETLVRISIMDNGSGIPAEDLHSIFNRYMQSQSNVARIRGGAGLGLAFCKLAVESFNGCIWAESENCEGSEFIILLPGCPGDTATGKQP